MRQVSFTPVGFVRCEFQNLGEAAVACEEGLDSRIKSAIVVRDEFKKGLTGLEEFSHVFVLYHLSGVAKSELLTYPGPASVRGLPQVGVFASRSQYRPNPVALRLVELVKVEGNEVHVLGLDAVNGSPVLDIKPYVPGFDRPKSVKSASWYDWINKQLY